LLKVHFFFIVFAGEQLGDGMDKASLPLPGNQDELIESVAGQNPHTVVVLNTSTPVPMPWLDRVDALGSLVAGPGEWRWPSSSAWQNLPPSVTGFEVLKILCGAATWFSAEADQW
jgi:Glycosyl hydrolase family 3 C-terminal domain